MIVTEPNRFRVCKALANLTAVYLFHDIRIVADTQPVLDSNQLSLLSQSLGHHVRTFTFDLPAPPCDLEQARLANCVALILPNLPNIRYLIILCDAWNTVTDSAIINAMAKLRHLERVAFTGGGYRRIDAIYSPSLPTFFNTSFNQILSFRGEQLTSLSLDFCPFHCAPGTFQLLRETMKNLQVLILNQSLPRSLWDIFVQPVTWACADRLVMLGVTDIHGAYVPTLVEHIANGRFGNLKTLLIDLNWADRDRNIVVPSIEWKIKPLDLLRLSEVPRLELEIFGCLHAKEVQVVGVSEQAVIELVRGGCFKEMTVLKVWQREWKYIRLEEVANACANRNTELLFK